MNRRCFPGCDGADERPAGRRGAYQGGGGSGQAAALAVRGGRGAAVRSGWSWSRPPAVASSSARGMASRSPLSSSWIWVGQLNPSARTTAPGAASRSGGSRLPLTSPAGLETEVAGEAAAAGLQVPGLGPGRGQQLLVRVPAEHGVRCQCTWVSTGRRTAAVVYPGVCSVSSSARVSVWSRSRTTRQSSWQQVAEHSESTRLQYALVKRGIAPQGLPPSGTGIINLQGECRGSVLRTLVQNRLRRVTRAALHGAVGRP
jgi:hypothetical protein